jgi:hypothetical protein
MTAPNGASVTTIVRTGCATYNFAGRKLGEAPDGASTPRPVKDYQRSDAGYEETADA